MNSCAWCRRSRTRLTRLGEVHHWRRGGRRSGRAWKLPIAERSSLGAKTAFGKHFAVEGEAIAFFGRVGKAVGGFEREDVVAGRGRGDGAAPADGVVVGVDFGTGLAFSQSAWTSRLGFGGDGAAGPVGGGEELGLQALIDAEGGARARALRRLRPAWSLARRGLACSGTGAACRRAA